MTRFADDNIRFSNHTSKTNINLFVLFITDSQRRECDAAHAAYHLRLLHLSPLPLFSSPKVED